MKKFIFSFVCALIFVGGTHVFADNIGVLDMEQLLLNYKKAQSYQEDLQKKREEYQKLVTEKQKKVEEAKKKGKSDEELQKMIEGVEEELRPKSTEILRNESTLQKQLFDEILATAKTVAKEYGIDVVVDKRVAFVGGFDLTGFILDRLNSRKKP